MFSIQINENNTIVFKNVFKIIIGCVILGLFIVCVLALISSDIRTLLPFLVFLILFVLLFFKVDKLVDKQYKKDAELVNNINEFRNETLVISPNIEKDEGSSEDNETPENNLSLIHI